MAGIGFELRKAFKQDTIHGKVKGVIYAAMTTIGPTILFMLLLLGIRNILGLLKVTNEDQMLFSSASLYIFLLSSIVSGALNNISTRFISDMIYEQKEEFIPATMFGTIIISTLLTGIVELIFCIVLYQQYGLSLFYLAGFYLFGIMITITYCVMTFISAIKEYAKITISYFIGICFSVIVFYSIRTLIKVTTVEAIIISMAIGFFVINILLIYYVISFFKYSNQQYFEFLSYFKKYPMLFFSGLIYVIGLYISNIIYWFFSDISVKIAIFHVAPAYDIATFFAVIINLSAAVIFTVKVETQVYEKYKVYLNSLNGANYSYIEKARINMENSLNINMFFIYEIQLIITIILTCLSVLFFPMLGIGGLTLDFFLLLGIAYYAIFSMYYTVVFLYYIMDQIGGFVANGIFLVVTAGVSILALRYGSGYYAVAPLTGAICGWLFAFIRLKYIIRDINANIFCGIVR